MIWIYGSDQFNSHVKLHKIKLLLLSKQDEWPFGSTSTTSTYSKHCDVPVTYKTLTSNTTQYHKEVKAILSLGSKEVVNNKNEPPLPKFMLMFEKGGCRRWRWNWTWGMLCGSKKCWSCKWSWSWPSKCIWSTWKWWHSAHLTLTLFPQRLQKPTIGNPFYWQDICVVWMVIYLLLLKLTLRYLLDLGASMNLLPFSIYQ